MCPRSYVYMLKLDVCESLMITDGFGAFLHLAGFIMYIPSKKSTKCSIPGIGSTCFLLGDIIQSTKKRRHNDQKSFSFLDKKIDGHYVAFTRWHQEHDNDVWILQDDCAKSSQSFSPEEMKDMDEIMKHVDYTICVSFQI